MSQVIIPSRQLFIDGKWQSPARSGRIPVINPANEETVGYIPSGTAEDVEIAVKSARAAFAKDHGRYWARTSGHYRAKFLRAIAAEVTAKQSELAVLESTDCGKPLDEALGDMEYSATCFKYYAGLAEAMDSRKNGTPIQLPMDTFKTNVYKEPIGVIGLITPWNYPLLMAAWKVAPALAAGCTAILKPSELASVTCLELAAIAEKVGLPAGVLNVITGLGKQAGAPLATHTDVDKISFTGSTATGKTIMGTAADVVKPVALELGGKGPIIVFDDVDMDKAVEWTMFGVFWTNGQICSATSRLLLQENIASEFLERIVEWAKTIKISDPLAEGCRLGPLVSEAQYKKVMKYISTAEKEGATLLCGGKRPEHLTKGYFVEPTVFVNVSTSSQIWNEEVFGPVLAVRTFKTEEEAIKLANDSQYGLGAAVMSKDDERCQRLAEQLEVGVVWINCAQPTFTEAPWGGIKRSGFGREGGEWGLDNYLTVKQVTRYSSEDQWGWYPKVHH